MPAGAERELVARCVVNATGPWAATLPHSHVRLRLTKGVHLVLDRGRLPVPSAVAIARERRLLFVIPWGERVIVGTTDTDYAGPPEAVRAEPDDENYILAAANEAFPAAGLGPSDVIRRWAGLRPLIAGRGRPSDISRAHQIRMPEPGWLDVAGGKLTTYRLIAEQAVDRLLPGLDRPASPCRTAQEPLLPPDETAAACRLVPPPIGAEAVRRFCRQEWAVHLDDVMVRRSGWHYYHADAGRIAALAAGWMAEALGWDQAAPTGRVGAVSGAARGAGLAGRHHFFGSIIRPSLRTPRRRWVSGSME